MKETNYRQAIDLMDSIKKETDDIGIFIDNGWGDSEQPTYYTIIKDGDGQKPLAWISKDTYDLLRENNLVGPNRLQTFKARRFHYFKEA